MSPQSANSVRRGVRWLLPAALLALTPKCILCLLGYAGLGAAIGLGGPEFCGASPDTTGAWMSSLVLVCVVFGIVGIVAQFKRRHTCSSTTAQRISHDSAGRDGEK